MTAGDVQISISDHRPPDMAVFVARDQHDFVTWMTAPSWAREAETFRPKELL